MPRNVLVIDPSVSDRSVIVSTLSRLGYRVRAAEGGADGLAAFAAEPADLVIAAVAGIEDAGTILDLRALSPRPKIIAVGAVDQPGRASNAYGADADAELCKPLSMSALLKVVRRLLDQAAVERARRAA